MKEKEFLKYLNQETWFHGTTLNNWRNLCEEKVRVEFNKGTELDFGYGFYLTPKYKSAENYIKRILPYIDAENEEDKMAVVIEFEIKFSDLVEKYNFTKFLGFTDDFAEFVFNNRINPDKKIHNYDFIIGPMTDSNPIQLLFQYKENIISKEEVIEGLKKFVSTTQASLHNQDICDILKVRKVTLVESGEELSADDYNI